MKSDTSSSAVVSAQQAYVDAWATASHELDVIRLRALRELTELQAAQHFATLLSPPGPYPLRPSSGLVEQQRILSRLRDVAGR